MWEICVEFFHLNMTKLKLLVILGSLILVFESCRTDLPTLSYFQSLPNGYTIFEKGDTSSFGVKYDLLNRVVSYSSPTEQEFINFIYDFFGRLYEIEIIEEDKTQKMEIKYSKNDEPISAVVSISKKGENSVSARKFIDYELKDGKVVGMKVLETGGSAHEVRLDYSGDDLVRVTSIGNAGFVSHEFELGRKRSPFASARFRHVLHAELPPIFYSTKEYTGHTILLSEGLTISSKIENHTDPKGTFLWIRDSIEILRRNAFTPLGPGQTIKDPLFNL